MPMDHSFVYVIKCGPADCDIVLSRVSGLLHYLVFWFTMNKNDHKTNRHHVKSMKHKHEMSNSLFYRHQY